VTIPGAKPTLRPKAVDASKHITGAQILIDGGVTLGVAD